MESSHEKAVIQPTGIQKPSGLNRIFDKIIDFFGFLGIILLFLMLVIVAVDICARYFFNKPFLWSHEVTEYAMVWVTFLSAAWVLRQEGHVIVDIIPSRISTRSKGLLFAVLSIIGVGIAAFLTWYGIKVVIDLFQTHRNLSTVLMPPAWILYIIIPLGSLVLVLQFIRRTVNNFNNWRHHPTITVNRS